MFRFFNIFMSFHANNILDPNKGDEILQIPIRWQGQIMEMNEMHEKYLSSM